MGPGKARRSTPPLEPSIQEQSNSFHISDRTSLSQNLAELRIWGSMAWIHSSSDRSMVHTSYSRFSVDAPQVSSL